MFGPKGATVCFWCLLLACAVICPWAEPAASTPRPGARAGGPLHVLLLYADDWRHDVLGCAGHPVVRTPALDALAAEGVRFTRSSVTTAICGVSRASILTGQWMSRHGNRGFDAFQTPWRETFPGVLRDDGWWVGHVGKWHNGAFPAAAYDVGAGFITSGLHWLREVDGSRVHVTERNARDAIAFLRERPSERPFCLTVAFFAPHAQDDHPDQYLPQDWSRALYEGVTVPVPPSASEGALRALPSFLSDPRNKGRTRFRKRFDTPERYQRSMRDYFALVTEVDEACGRIIEELRRQGILDRTLVVFTTDNGYLHGEHGLADKWYPFEESIRVPLIVRDPRTPRARRGTTCDARVLNVDVAPTILVAAGASVPAGMQGRDLGALLQGTSPPGGSWRTEFLYEHPTIGSVGFIPSSKALVTERWKYVVWPDFGLAQLFDLWADPQELRDLAPDPAQAGRMADMERRLAEHERRARGADP